MAGPLDGLCRQLLAALPDGLVLVEDGRILLVNPELTRMSGFRSADLVGAPLETLVPEAAAARHSDLRRRFEAAPRARPMGGDLLLGMRCADGTELPVEVALAPLRLDGRVATLATVRDVGHRRLGDAERRRLVEVLDLVPDCIIVAEEGSGRVLALNRAAALLLGSGTLGSVRDQWATADRGVRAETVTARDGSLVECEVHSSVVTVNDGDRVVVSVVRDVSDVHELRHQLERTQSSFRTAFEQAPVGIAVTRQVGGRREFVRTNTAFTTMFGYGPGGLDGCDTAVLRATEDSQEAGLPHPHLASGPLLDTTVIRRYRRPDGTHLWAETRATALEGMGDGVPHFLVHAVDVTQRVEAEHSAHLHALVTQIVADATTAALERRSEESVLELLSTGAAEVLDADAVAVLRDDPAAPEGYTWSAAIGPLGDALTASVDAAGGTALLERAARDGATPLEVLPGCAQPDSCPVGPVLLAPLGTAGRDLHGGLVAARAPGRPAFTTDDAERLSRLATQTQAAAHFARGRADQERVALLEERQRIARALHDTVIQDVIAVGMVLSAQAGRETDTALAASTLDSVGRLERAVSNLRTAVFELRTDSGRGSLGATLTAVIEEASRVLGFFPTLTLSGPVDALDDGLAEDLVGALREALANVARHARATSCAVSVTVSPDTVKLVVDDNGVGPGSGPRLGYGLGYLEDRAQRHHGHLTVGAGPVDGTRLVWTCPRGSAGAAP